MCRKSAGSRESSTAAFPGAFPSLGGGFVCHAMDLESAGVREGSRTIGPRALVFFRTRMKKLMVLEARVGLEGRAASGARAVELLARLVAFSHRS